MKLFSGFTVIIAVIVAATCLPSQLVGQVTVASEDFDGGAINLISGFDPATENLDGGGGDWFGVGSLAVWPQVDGVPFNLVDDSAVGFPPDRRGCYSLLTSDMANNFFGISDTREWNDKGMGGGPLVASWTFDVSSATGTLQFCVDMAQQTDVDSFGGFDVGYVLFEYSIDGGPFATAISCGQFDSTGSGFIYRLNDLMAINFTSGGPQEPEVGDEITGAISGATAMIAEIQLDDKSGSWAGGEAFGRILLSNRVGTFGVENVNEGANLDVFTIRSDAGDVCQATGPGLVEKVSAVDGSVSSNTILDKCPPVGDPGAGTIDTFVTDLDGLGSTIEIRMTTELPFDAMAFDNIKIVDVGGGVPVVVPGESLTVAPGIINSGGLPDLEDSDNDSLVLFRDPTSTAAVTQFVLTATSPTTSPTTFEFVLEGRCVSRPNVVQRVEFFNYVTGAFENVDEQNAVRMPPDLSITVTPTGDLSRFVDPANGEIQARVRYRADSPRASFSSRTDQAIWMIQ